MRLHHSCLAALLLAGLAGPAIAADAPVAPGPKTAPIKAAGVRADRLRLGFEATLSGAGGVTGTQARRGFDLALEQHGGKLGGLPVTIVTGDDQQKPEIGRQNAMKMVESDHVDMIVAATYSNVMLAMAPPVTQSRTFLFSMVAGPSQLAGKECSPYFFNTSWQGDNFAEAMGAYLQSKGIQDVAVMAPNYAAGHDVVTGFKRYFHNHITSERFTPLTQMDFAAELAELRAEKPKAVFAFYPGGLGIQFLKQYAQSGLGDTLPLYTSYTIDETGLPAIGDSAIGKVLTTFWSATMDNPANKAFVAAFTKKYGTGPSYYAAQAYDAANLIDSAITLVGGHIADHVALTRALERADFASVRGKFRYANDHFPIQDYYLGKVVRGADGKAQIALGAAVLKDHGNAYEGECPLK